MIGANAGDEAGDGSVGPHEGEEGGDDNGAKGAHNAIITRATQFIQSPVISRQSSNFSTGVLR